MNIHDEIKKLAPNLHKEFKNGDMYYAGNNYKINGSTTKERVVIEPSGAIILKIDSIIGKHFSKVLNQNGVSYREDSGRYNCYSAKNLRNAGLLNLQSTTQNSEVLELEKHDQTRIEEDILEIISSETKGPTEKVQFINARIGQGQFRKSLLSYWGECAVTSVRYPAMLLASHIKPWTKSSDYERLDQFNGLLLTPNLDRAFDQGLISFTETGLILLSESLKDAQKLGINSEMNIELAKEHQQYMKFHREIVFKNT